MSSTVSSTVLAEIDRALAAHDPQQAPPVAIRLGAHWFTQLTLDAARGPLPGLSTDAGRPLAYRHLELLRDEVDVDGLRVI
ncbi:hypothetical protein [Hymenobacter coccineus]|uniref:Uncharacterized protein n=1 Tax=Hymenobacter coccineus TaxID=1908235 RepID=A0A1G1TK05_9BACT|nr:hypothetical protein [Hymenobacter coccineus]OGX91203.1 hypothetical protein BEN49_20610 [Hymenobacter coccineus]